MLKTVRCRSIRHLPLDGIKKESVQKCPDFLQRGASQKNISQTVPFSINEAPPRNALECQPCKALNPGY